MFIKYLALLIIITCSNPIAAESRPAEEFMIESTDKTFCSNSEYIGCMNVTREICIKSYKKAYRLCASKNSYENIPSPVCVTDNYINFMGVSEKTVESCEEIAAKIAGKTKNAPNK